MKRIAALAAVVIGLLAIPTTAMASTVGSGGSGSTYGSGYGTPGWVQPGACYYGFDRGHHHHNRYFDWWLKGREFTGGYCPFPQQFPLPGQQQPQPQPQPQPCYSSQTLTFSVAAGSSVMTEVSGPQLTPTEEFVYDNNTYTIMSVDPGADQFTAFVNNVLFVNNGAAIYGAAGALVCGSN
jgi:hypothetical protein